MKHAPQPIPVEHEHAPMTFPLTTLLLTFVFGMVAGGLLIGVATLDLHERAAAREEGRP